MREKQKEGGLVIDSVSEECCRESPRCHTHEDYKHKMCGNEGRAHEKVQQSAFSQSLATQMLLKELSMMSRFSRFVPADSLNQYDSRARNTHSSAQLCRRFHAHCFQLVQVVSLSFILGEWNREAKPSRKGLEALLTEDQMTACRRILALTFRFSTS